jgi:KDO2-lipid IV(A) lauroyltransferase
MPAWQSFPLWAFITICGIVSTLRPRSAEMFVGPLLGRLLLALDPKRWRVAEDNLKRCLPELGPDGRWELIKANYRHYGVLAFELMHLFSPFKGHYRRYIRRISVLEGYENWKRASDKGRGVVFASSHMGNWEVMAAAGGLAGMKLTIVTRRLKPEWLLRRVEASRLSVGVKAAYQPRTLPAIMRALRNGESVGFVIDQYASPPMGMPAVFFGTRVDTLAAVGPLIERTGAALVPVTTWRDPEGIVHVRIEPELALGKAAKDPAAVTQLLASKVESWVRACPEQWLWVHRRFKNLG